jgi:hypothetical protein
LSRAGEAADRWGQKKKKIVSLIKIGLLVSSYPT